MQTNTKKVKHKQSLAIGPNICANSFPSKRHHKTTNLENKLKKNYFCFVLFLFQVVYIRILKVNSSSSAYSSLLSFIMLNVMKIYVYS